ncbi:MAG: cell division protein FtsZ [Alphaproteobacteria bacterium]|nr:cell division protein FtsZ [Alphaproteobacteria bacterium]
MADTEFLKELPIDDFSIGLPEPAPEILITPKIGVIGVGGAGGNAVQNMIQSDLKGTSFIVANTDAQALMHSLCKARIQLGAHITQGLGAGARPTIGQQAAEEVLDKIKEAISPFQMLFITAGMGGGTGTGASPVVAKLAKEMGILTVGVVTKPFRYEGKFCMKTAEKGLEELEKYVDTLLIIPNQNLFRLTKSNTNVQEAFKMADDVMMEAIKTVTDLIMNTGKINLDFADVTTIMKEMGRAMMSSGEAEGENRALSAVEKALTNPLLDETSILGSKSVLINITGGCDLQMEEIDEAVERIQEDLDETTRIISGFRQDTEMDGKFKISIIATGLSKQQETPTEKETLEKPQEEKPSFWLSAVENKENFEKKEEEAPVIPSKEEKPLEEEKVQKPSNKTSRPSSFEPKKTVQKPSLFPEITDEISVLPERPSFIKSKRKEEPLFSLLEEENASQEMPQKEEDLSPAVEMVIDLSAEEIEDEPLLTSLEKPSLLGIEKKEKTPFIPKQPMKVETLPPEIEDSLPIIEEEKKKEEQERKNEKPLKKQKSFFFDFRGSKKESKKEVSPHIKESEKSSDIPQITEEQLEIPAFFRRS